MVLADSSIWADHLRSADELMTHLLATDQIVMHPFVLGELAMGNLPDRPRFLKRLADLPTMRKAGDVEVMQLIEVGDHSGKGLGWVDMHLLASVLLDARVTFWTRDRRLNTAASGYGRSLAAHH